MRYLLRLCLSSIFVCSLAMGAIAADKKHWRLTPDHAKCLKSNLEKYKAITDDPIIVFLKACPEIDRLSALQKLQKNSDPGIKVTDDTKHDAILVFNRAEIACLNVESFSEEAGDILIPKNLACD